MTVIKAAHYGETETQLKHNPIVGRMQMDIMHALRMGGIEVKGWWHESGQPTHTMMSIVNGRFHRLEDANPQYRHTGPLHIGAVANTLTQMLREAHDAILSIIDKLDAGDEDHAIFLDTLKVLAPIFAAPATDFPCCDTKAVQS